MADSVISLPSVTLNILRAKGLVGLTEHKILVVGQKTASGTATAGELSESVQLDGDIETKFGETSLITQMLRAIRGINQETQVDAIPLADAGGATAATAVITFTGTATAAGTLNFEIASAENRTYSVDVLSGDTVTDIADALTALVTADTKAPFTAANVAGVFTATAENAGTIANGFLLRTTGSVAGITVTLTTPWAGGATDPTLTGLFDPIDGQRYQTILYPGAYSVDTLTDLLDPRFNATNIILDGVGIISRTDTLSNIKTQAEAINSQSVVMIANKPVSTATFEGSHAREMDDVVAAQLAAARALRLTDGANLANVVTTTSGPLDTFGGISLSTLPYFNTPFANLPVPIIDTFWTTLEVADLEDSGASVIGPNKSRQGVIAGEIFTTSTTDGTGNPDTSFKYLNTVDASVSGREFQFNNIKSRYTQSRLTTGDLVAGRSIENEDSVKAFVQSLYKELADLAVYQAGDTAFRYFAQTLVVSVTLTPGSGTVSITQEPPLVGQLRAVQGTIQVNFSTEAQ